MRRGSTRPDDGSIFPGTILSGGRSSRMGEPKALLGFGAARLIDHVAARLAPQVTSLTVNSNDANIGIDGLPSLPDLVSGHPGPLAGIHAALVHEAGRGRGSASHVMIAPVDAPFFPQDLVRRLAAALSSDDAVALAASAGRLHPVAGLWPLSVLPRLSAWLADPPTLKVTAFLEGLPLCRVEIPMLETGLGPVDPFFNVNTPGDLDIARRLLATDDGAPLSSRR